MRTSRFVEHGSTAARPGTAAALSPIFIDKERKTLTGTAAWFMAKHHEQMAHAHKIYLYLIDQDARVFLTLVDAPPSDPEGAVNIFELTP